MVRQMLLMREEQLVVESALAVEHQQELVDHRDKVAVEFDLVVEPMVDLRLGLELEVLHKDMEVVDSLVQEHRESSPLEQVH